MVAFLFKGFYFISPILMIFFFVFYFLYSKKKLYFSLGFLAFSSLTYLLHINPYLLKEQDNFSLGDLVLEEPFKIALLTNYVGDPIRDEFYLNFLWEDLKQQGFNAMIVRENFFNLNGFLNRDSTWVIFPKEGIEDSLSVVFDYNDWLLMSRDSTSPILWIDSKEGSFYSELLWNNFSDDSETFYITLPEDLIHWSSLLKPVDLRVISL